MPMNNLQNKESNYHSVDTVLAELYCEGHPSWLDPLYSIYGYTNSSH